MMKQILLTDEKILKILSIHAYTIEEAEAILNNAGRAIANAQLKKVGIELKKRVIWVQGNIVISFKDEDWQSLLKEIE